MRHLRRIRRNVRLPREIRQAKNFKEAASEFFKTTAKPQEFYEKYLRVQCQHHSLQIGNSFRFSSPNLKCSDTRMGTNSSTPAPPPTPVVGSGSIESTSTESTGFHIVKFHGTIFSVGGQSSSSPSPPSVCSSTSVSATGGGVTDNVDGSSRWGAHQR